MRSRPICKLYMQALLPLLLLPACCCIAQNTGSSQLIRSDLPKTDIPFERFFQYPKLTGTPPTDVVWAKDNKHIVFRWNPKAERFQDLYTLELPNGKPTRLVDGSKLPHPALQDDERSEAEKKEEIQYDAGPSAAIWSPDSKELLFTYKGVLYTIESNGTNLRQRFASRLGPTNPDYSRDGRYISFSLESNIFLISRKMGDIRQLTTVSKPNTSISGYDWSPDSSSLLISWSDNTSSKSVLIPDYTKDKVEARSVKRDIVGQSESVQKVGIVQVEGTGIIKWIDNIPDHFYNYGTEWSPDSTRAALSEMSSDFKSWRLRVIDVKSLKAIQAAEDKSSKYVSDWRPIRWSSDGHNIYFGSDRDGWRHIWKVGAHGGTPEVVTPGSYDIGAFDRPKYSDDIIYESTEKSSLEFHVFRLTPEGKKTELTGSMPVNSPTFADSPLMNGTYASEDGKMVLLNLQDRTHPPDLYLAAENSASHEPIRLTHSPLPDFEKMKLVKPENVKFTSTDGKEIHGLLFKPAHLVAGKRYGVVISDMYADSAKNRWGGLLDSYAASELGLAVLCIDFRSSWGYGADFASGYYHSLGQVDADEAVSAANFLKSLDFIDPNRLGVWGWSYGGYLTEMIMCTRPGTFSTGVAVAPVTDWKHYNEWYTRHRLDEPKDAEEDYKKSSPVNFAAGLKGHLLMIHGMQDDNVLFQDTVQMVQKLIEAGKDFDVAFYPKDDHSIGRDDSRVHVYRRIYKYLYMWLGSD